MLPFTIANYKSIDIGGIRISGSKELNLFIGKNNTGKSNVLTFLHHFHQVITNAQAFPNQIETGHNRNPNSPRFILHLSLAELNFPENYQKRNADTYRNDDYNFSDALPQYIDFTYLCYEKRWEVDTRLKNIEYAAHAKLSNHFGYGNISGDISHDTSRYFEEQAKNRAFEMFSKLKYISDLRFIKEGVDFDSTSTALKGSNIISELFKMQNPMLGDEEQKAKFNLINKQVSELLDMPDLIIAIPHTRDAIYIESEGWRLPVASFGRGIHEMIILCCGILLHPDHVICLEEPELHLHPHLQKKFVRFLLLLNNVFFISTHSNAFLDCNWQKTAIFYLQKKSGSTKVTLCSSDHETTSALFDLGYKSSDLLQTNGVIWVEGPSDRNFLKKWISILSDEWIEGVHYSIMFYGGRLLANVTYSIENINEDLIPLLKLNRNAFVLIDSDITITRQLLNATKQRIGKEIGSENCWITSGKEIENYLSVNSINSWLKKKNDEVQIKEFGSVDRLDDIIGALTLEFRYSANKNRYSKEICQFITAEDIDILNLREMLERLFLAVAKWNS